MKKQLTSSSISDLVRIDMVAQVKLKCTIADTPLSHNYMGSGFNLYQNHVYWRFYDAYSFNVNTGGGFPQTVGLSLTCCFSVLCLNEGGAGCASTSQGIAADAFCKGLMGSTAAGFAMGWFCSEACRILPSWNYFSCCFSCFPPRSMGRLCTFPSTSQFCSGF